MLECLCPKTVCLNSNGNLPFQRTRIGFSRFEGEVLIVLILKCKLQKHNIDFPFSLGIFGGFWKMEIVIFWQIETETGQSKIMATCHTKI